MQKVLEEVLPNRYRERVGAAFDFSQLANKGTRGELGGLVAVENFLVVLASRRGRLLHERERYNRRTLITDLAENGASDQTILDITGHVSKQMLKHLAVNKRHAN
jgi:hypothetical protein